MSQQGWYRNLESMPLQHQIFCLTSREQRGNRSSAA